MVSLSESEKEDRLEADEVIGISVVPVVLVDIETCTVLLLVSNVTIERCDVAGLELEEVLG